MNRIGSLLKKDIVLGFKDIFIILEVLFAAVFSAILVFVIPEDIRTVGKAYIYDQTGVIEDFINEHYPDAGKTSGDYFVSDRDAVIEGITEDKGAVGILISSLSKGSGSAGDALYRVDLLTQPYTKAGAVDYIETDMEDLLMIISPPYGRYPADVYDSVRIEANKRGEHEIIPFNKRILPTFLVFNVGLIGLFAMVSLIGQERIDMTIRAYRLSPSSLWYFILSKHLMLIIVSALTFAILYIPLMGFDGFGKSFAVMMLTVLTMSSFGILLASFYRTPMESLGWVFIIMVLLALPAVSIMNPVFSPGWLKLIPSFHTLFALDAAMFPDGNAEVYKTAVLVLSILMVIMVPLSAAVFRKRVGKEA